MHNFILLTHAADFFIYYINVSLFIATISNLDSNLLIDFSVFIHFLNILFIRFYNRLVQVILRSFQCDF